MVTRISRHELVFFIFVFVVFFHKGWPRRGTIFPIAGTSLHGKKIFWLEFFHKFLVYSLCSLQLGRPQVKESNKLCARSRNLVNKASYLKRTCLERSFIRIQCILYWRCRWTAIPDKWKKKLVNSCTPKICQNLNLKKEIYISFC